MIFFMMFHISPRVYCVSLCLREGCVPAVWCMHSSSSAGVFFVALVFIHLFM